MYLKIYFLIGVAALIQVVQPDECSWTTEERELDCCRSDEPQVDEDLFGKCAEEYDLNLAEVSGDVFDPCAEECIWKRKQYLDGEGKPNLIKLLDSAKSGQTTHAGDDLNTWIDIIETCMKQNDTWIVEEGKCKSGANLAAHCLNTGYYMRCAKWKDSPECNETRKKITKCKDKLLMPPNLIAGTSRYAYRSRDFDKENGYVVDFSYSSYNSTYPLTKPVSIHDKVRYRIGLVTDLDHSSRSRDASNTWESFFLQGYLMWNPISMTVSITWDDGRPRKLQSTFGHNGRGMELSELVTFDGRLLTFDDRSGIVFVLENENFYPWLLLLDGNGKNNKGFKSEWATVKDEKLYVGGLGKEWTTATGEFVNYNPMWIKVINRYGEVSHLNWVEKFKAVRSKLGIEFPGYMIHEAVVWSNIHKKWFFLPRRASHNTYNEDADEMQGTNILLAANEDFSDISVTHVGEVIPTHGFSSFKFLPGTRDEVIVALKTVEFKGRIESYIMVFTIHGRVILGESRIPDDVKYEGFEFI